MIEPGTRIGGLLIGELLGRGAMGEVYRAVQVSLKRPVAVKRIAGHLVDNPDMVARFEREAQCIARIQHTNVVGIHEFGQYADAAGGLHFLLVMELVEGGRSLKSFLHGAMDWRVASSVMLQTAEGLAAAGEQGVVHRDIKPDNIMLTNKGVAKLTDFGLAKAVDSSAMTMGGTLLGTPAYMPPEACRGEATDHRGDLYSLGATWYHLLSGHVPFRSDNTMAMLRAHLEEPAPDILALFPAVPEPIADLVRRCMAKKPEDRPVSAQQLANELKALVAQGIHLKQAVPELVDLPQAAQGDPSTIATLVAGGPAAPSATAATALAKPAAAPAPAAAATDRATMATIQATIQQPAAPAAERRRASPLLYLVPAIALAALAAWAWSALGGAAPAAAVPGTAAASATNPPAGGSPAAAVSAAPTGASIPPAHLARADLPPAPAAPPPPPPPPRAVPAAGEPPVPAPAAPAPAAAPEALVAAVAPPRAPAAPTLAVAPPPSQPPPPPLPPALATLPPPPPPLQLRPPQLIKPAREAAVTDNAIIEFRAAVRSKRALRAEACLSSIAADAGGYRDMVRNLTQLKAEQDAAFAGLSRAAAAGQAAVLLEAMAQATAYPELGSAIGQCRAWIALMEERWKAALARADEAIGRHDASGASALLGEVPADPAMLTAPYAAQRAATAARLSAAGR